MTPQNLSRLDINRGEWRWSKVAARTVDRIADANRVGKVNPHQAVRPQLLDSRFVASATELQDATAAAVATGNEEQIVRSPNRHARVQAKLNRMRVTP